MKSWHAFHFLQHPSLHPWYEQWLKLPELKLGVDNTIKRGDLYISVADRDEAQGRKTFLLIYS